MEDLNSFIIVPINGDELFRYIPNLIPVSDGCNSEQKVITSVEKSSIFQDLEENEDIGQISTHRVQVSDKSNERTIECAKCKEIFNESKKYKDHLKSQCCNITLVCRKCDKDFSDISAYEKHLISHQEEKLYNCLECNNGFNWESNFKIHMVLHGDSLICPICDLKFQRRASLKSHLAIHQVEEFHTCSECSSEFDNLVDLKRHIKLHLLEYTTLQKELICNYCKVRFDSAVQLKQHVESHVQIKKLVLNRNRKKTKQHQPRNKEHKHKCSICSKTFFKLSLLERHARIHSGERPYVCEICHKGFTQKSTLQIHMTKHSGIKPYSCTLCPARFNQKGNLKVHVQKTHLATREGEKIFKCTECDCIFKRVASLNGHMTKAHVKDTGVVSITTVIDQLKNLNEMSGNILKRSDGIEQIVEYPESKVVLKEIGEEKQVSKVYPLKQKFVGTTKVYICSYCGKETKKPSDLIKHIRIHTKEKPYKCHCGNFFSLKSTLLSHMQIHKGKIGRKCLKCSRVFFSAKVWHSHSRTHDLESEKLKTFGQDYQNLETDLPAPELPHKKKVFEKTQKCNICSASFMRKVNLKRHMLLHTGERKYKCEICSRTFIAAYSLKEHMKTHTGLKNYGCSLCDKKFVNKSLLKRHLLVHDAKKPHECVTCRKGSKNALACGNHNDQTFQNATQKEPSVVCAKGAVLTSETFENAENPTTVLEINSNGEIVGGIYDAFRAKSCTENLNLGNIKNGDATSLISPTTMIELAQNSNLQTIFVNYPEGQNGEQLNNYFFPQLKLQSNDTVVLSSETNLEQPPIVFDVETIGGETLPVINVNNETNSNNHTEELINLLSGSQEDLLLEKVQESLPNLDADDSLSHNDISDHFLANNISLYPNTQVTFDNPHEKDGNQLNIVTLEQTNNLEEMKRQENYVDGNLNILNASWENCEESVVNLNIVHCTVCKRMFEGLGPFQSHICMKSILKKNINVENSVTTDEITSESVPEEAVSGKTCKKSAKKNFVCVYCSKQFQKRGLYMRHVNIHKKNGNGLHRCQFCDKQFKKPSDLARHLRTHTGEKPFACHQCDKKFSLKSTLDSHYRTHNPSATKDFVCEVCNSFFSSKSSRKIHMLCHTGSKRQKCSYCDEHFRTRAHKRSHEQKIHINRSKGNVQRKNKKITNILAEAADMAINAINEDQMLNKGQATGLTEIQLEFSDQTIHIDQALLQQWQNSSILLQNIDQDIEQPSTLQMNEGIVEETIVDNIELFNSSINDQEVDNDAERNLKCGICNKTYASKDVLRKHMQLHSTKKYVCEQCNKSFSSVEGLIEHEKLHSGYRPFSCFLCTNSFAEAHHLKVHLKRIHQIIDTTSPLILKMSTGEKLDLL